MSRKLILQMYMTLDGFVAGPKGELDWIFNLSDTECMKFADDLLNSSDVILLGRVLAQEFLEYWPGETNEFAQKINNLPKIVFSKSLDTIETKSKNVRLVKDVAEEIKRLKNEPGKNLILYGGASIVQTFIKLDLIDEYNLFIAPVILGNGLALFNNLDERLNLNLLKSKATDTGVVILSYVPAKK